MSWSDRGYEAVAEYVGRRTGMTFTSRQEGAELGIRRAMERAGVADPARYLGLLAAEEAALDDLVAEPGLRDPDWGRAP